MRKTTKPKKTQDELTPLANPEQPPATLLEAALRMIVAQKKIDVHKDMPFERVATEMRQEWLYKEHDWALHHLTQIAGPLSRGEVVDPEKEYPKIKRERDLYRMALEMFERDAAEYVVHHPHGRNEFCCNYCTGCGFEVGTIQHTPTCYLNILRKFS